jgi:hypothetical protein
MIDTATTLPAFQLDRLLFRTQRHRRYVLIPLGLGILVLLGARAAASESLERFWAAYLVAFVFFLTLALGGLFFVLLQFATRAGWSAVVRRLAENAFATLPLLTLLFVPVLFAKKHLYPWASADAELSHAKAIYFSTAFFNGRAGLYWLAWLAVAAYYYRASVHQDENGDQEITRRLQYWAPLGLVVFGIATTFAAFDWVMSLFSPWYSTMFGVYIFSGSAVAIMSLLIVVIVILQLLGRLTRDVTTEHYHDMGKLLFAFVVFWAYIAFSQFMLIWYGNLPEETVFFAQRFTGSWLWASVFLALGHFVLPFFWLISRRSKRNRGRLAAAALWMLAMHFFDVYWLVMPGVRPLSSALAWVDLLVFLGMAGLFGGMYVWLLSIRPLLPLRDPRLKESLAFENA